MTKSNNTHLTTEDKHMNRRKHRPIRYLKFNKTRMRVIAASLTERLSQTHITETDRQTGLHLYSVTTGRISVLRDAVRTWCNCFNPLFSCKHK